MDLLQIALVLLILLLAVMLSILGIQVFFILKDLRKSLDKLEIILSDAHEIAEDIEKPMAAVAGVAQVVETGAKLVAKKIAAKPAKRLFKRN